MAKSTLVSTLSEPTFAWEPVTPRGVAAFARASVERLLIVQAVFAALAAAAVMWTCADGFFPTITDAVNQLPATGQIRSGQLDFPAEFPPTLLAEGRLLAINVDLKHSEAIRSPAQLQFEFGENSLCIYSLFGYTEIPYPVNPESAPLNRTDLVPIWGAWRPDLLALIGLGAFFGLLASWFVLASAYFVPVWIICFFSNRDLGLLACWRLAGAALMPGALLLTTTIMLYDLGGIDVVQLCFAFGMHIIVGWIYLFVSPLFLNRCLPPSVKNPFDAKNAEKTGII
jgi:hypothetical protein